MEPSTLLQSNWIRLVAGVVHATDNPTCNGSCFDYFVVSKNIAHAVHAVQRITDAGTNPHFPARLLVRGNARRYLVRTLQRPGKVPGFLPQGPPRQPPQYPCATKLQCNHTDTAVEEATKQWYTAARQEWSDLLSYDVSFKVPAFKWKPVMGSPAKPWVGNCACSTKWRELARRAQDIIRCLSCPHRQPNVQLIKAHCFAIACAYKCIPKSFRAEHAQAFRSSDSQET